MSYQPFLVTPILLMDIDCSEPSDMSVKNEAMRALLCYAALPETQWTSIITAFRRMQSHELSNLFFTAGHYIDSFWYALSVYMRTF